MVVDLGVAVIGLLAIFSAGAIAAQTQADLRRWYQTNFDAHRNALHDCRQRLSEAHEDLITAAEDAETWKELALAAEAKLEAIKAQLQ